MLQQVDPRTICVAIPSKMSALDVMCVKGLCNVIGTGRLANQPMLLYGGSNIGAVRNMIAHQFMSKSDLEWLVMIDDDIGFGLEDWDLLWEDHGGELAVVAEYLQKIDGERRVAHFGCGFCRVHRRVFELLTQLTGHDGAPWVSQGIYSGVLLWEYFPQGVNAAGEYRQEDHGFWQLVRATEVPVRIETRTRLIHSGRSSWIYDHAQIQADLCELGGAQ